MKVDKILINEIVDVVNEYRRDFENIINNNKDRIERYLLLFTAKQNFNFAYRYPYYMIDVYNWMKDIETINLISDGSEIVENLEKKYSSKLSSIKNKLFQNGYRYKAGDFFSQYPKFRGITTNSPSGLSIYFPTKLDVDELSYKIFIEPGSENQSSFIEKNPDWLNFIKLISL